jgi:uncharacterized delta-60 repeat protein
MTSNAYLPGFLRTSGEEKHELSPGIDTAWVRHHASGLAPLDDYVRDFVVDGDGNIYITGSTATVKYDAHGNLRWSVQCKDDRYGSFYPYEIAVDGSEGVFVGGARLPWETSGLIVVKYGPEGDLKWSITIDSASISDDGYVPSLLIVPDGNRNVLLATSHFDPAGKGTWSAALRKYDATGALKWTALIDSYCAIDMKCDALGNVFLVSSRGNTSEGWDWLLTKYASDGQEKWSTRDSLGVYAVALARDGNGNTYVTGSSTYEWWLYRPGISLTAKYDTAGSRQWVNSYDSLDCAGSPMRIPRWLGVDPSGRLLVAGSMDQGMVIVKHDSSGGIEWFVRRDSVQWQGSSSDSDGGVVALYYPHSASYGISKCDVWGNELWTRELSGFSSPCQALCVDASGNIVLVGNPGTSCDYAVLKLDRNGIERWRKTYGEVGLSRDRAIAVAADKWGNCYVGGSSVVGQTFADFVILRYDQGGTERWVSRFSDPGPLFEEISDIVTDGEGSVYSVGGSGEQLRTFKHTSEGKLVWEQRWSAMDYWRDGDALIARDQVGRLYVAGTGYSAENYDIVLVSYTADGQERWVRGLDSAWHEGMALDPQGNVVVVGTFRDSTERRQFKVTMFDSAGNRKWLAVFHPSVFQYERLVGVAVDRQGNTIIAGSSGQRCVVVKFDPAGMLTWVTHSPMDVVPDAVGVDARDNIIVTGCTSYPRPSDLVAMRWDPDGQLVWVRTFGDAEHQEEGSMVAFDSAGSVYLVGSSELWSEPYTLAVITLKYDSDGQCVWHARYQGPGAGSARARDLEITRAGEIFLTGISECPWPDVESSMFTIKYKEVVTSQDTRWTDRLHECVLHQNFPNPFNPSTTICYTIPARLPVTLMVFNTLGQQVATVVQGEQEAGFHEALFDASRLASGVYIYRLQAGDFVDSKKFVLVR